MTEIKLITLSIRDFFRKDILGLALYPFIITLIVLVGIFTYTADLGLKIMGDNSIQIHQEKTEVVNGIPTTTTIEEEYKGSSIVDFFLHNSVTSGLISFVVYTLGTLATIIFSVFIAVVIVGFFTPLVLKKIIKIHYPDYEQKGYGNIFSGLWVLFRSFFVMVFMLFIFIPLYFIPVLNIVAFNLPFYYFFHKILDYDVSSEVVTKELYSQIKIIDRDRIRVRTLILYLASLVPFVGILFPLLYVIYIGHGYLNKAKELSE